jgi:flagellar motility protein MotE (MotC chaperone)
MRSEQWCYVHHPDLADRRQAASRKGGHRGGRGRPVAELQDVKRQLRELADSVMDGETDRADAAIAGQLLGTYIRAVSVEVKLKEVLEMEERLAALEQSKGERWGA